MIVAGFPLTRVVSRDEIPESGLELVIEANAEELAALAAYLDIPDVEALTAELVVSRWRSRGLAVRGRLEARVVQTCVVTLEPVTNLVAEEIEVHFAPEGELGGAADLEAAQAGELDVEPMPADRIDVGALVAEHVALGLDPYPRKPGAVFKNGGSSLSGDRSEGAFAALAALRGRRQDD